MVLAGTGLIRYSDCLDRDELIIGWADGQKVGLFMIRVDLALASPWGTLAIVRHGHRLHEP
jgi:hypothetical protein